MQSFLSVLALAASAAVVQASLPGCSPDHSSTFGWQDTQLTARDLEYNERRAIACNTNAVTLSGGVLTSIQGKTGYIASNEQLQFDKPVQAGAKITSGFSVCQNGSLALDDSAIFYSCASGTFANVYDESIASYCFPITLVIYECDASGASSIASSAPATSVASSSSSSTSEVATSASSTLASVTVVSVSSAAVSSAAATPFPVAGNGTVAATGSVAASATTSAATSPIASASPAASAFKGAASVLAVGQGFVAMVAAAGAFFML